ncbi:MAG: hypothetical protein QS748_07020 [Candidatus Endonucleobacter bathymodioli]|uniref:Uncharacterized protein n=1 Tax=Candidatus Endonucleibacter bathymodioli TaxID=539814 RepID=A0AA90P0W9_9GAMM|nr:hypothetical protein [Candidatus Endonucleobacter bathymodioli]
MNIYNYLANWKNELCHVYKHTYNFLYGMFFMLTLVFCNQAFSVIGVGFDHGGDKTVWDTHYLKELFFDSMMNSYSGWLCNNSVKGGIIGSAGIRIMSGDSSLIDINDMDIVVCGKDKAEDLLKYLNSEIQKSICVITDKNLVYLANTVPHAVWGAQGMSDEMLGRWQITMFDISSNEPLAAVGIVVKDFDGDDVMFSAWDYDFQTDFNFVSKKKVSIPVLTQLGYALLDDNSLKKDIEYFKKTKDNKGKKLGDTMDEVVYLCQNMHKIRNRFSFYEQTKKEKSYDKKLMEKIYEVHSSYDILLNEVNKINEKTQIVNTIHAKAFDFDYALGESLGDKSLLTHVEWQKVLGKDFSVCNVESRDDCFCCVVSNAINGNRIVRERFLSAANRLRCEVVDAETEYVTSELVRSVINNWVKEMICVLLNEKYDKNEMSRFLDLPYGAIDHLMSSEYDKSSNHAKDVISFCGDSVSLLPLALSIGIPFVVFNSKNHASKVAVSSFNPEDAWNEWRDIIEVLVENESLMTLENTMVKDVIFIAHSGKNNYYSCIKKNDIEKRIEPLLIAEEILLDKNILQSGSCQDELYEELDVSSNVMPTMCDSFPWNEKAAKAKNTAVYVELVKKCIGICFCENSEVVGSTLESKEISTEKDINSQPISIVNKEDSGSLGVNIDKIFRDTLLDTAEVVDGMELLVEMTEAISLGVEKVEDICEMKTHLRGKEQECKQKIKYSGNIDEINKVMTVVFDEVSEQCQQDKYMVDNRVVVNLSKCSSVIKQLSNADDLGCPLAPLILGVYRMIYPDGKYLVLNDIVGVIRCFIKAAERGNVQAPACLYWLAKITGSPEAFSLSISLFERFNQSFSDDMLVLNFVLTGNDHLVKECNNLWLPLFLGRWRYQRIGLDAFQLLCETYYSHPELGEDSSGCQMSQNLSDADVISYASHLAFFYLHSGHKESAMQEFSKAAFAYVWLMQKTDDISVIPNIIKAAGVASIYHMTSNDEARSIDHRELLEMLSSLSEIGSNSDFLWTLKIIGQHEQISASADFISKVSYFLHRKNEGVVFKNIDDLGSELAERRDFLECKLSHSCECGNARKKFKLDMSDISVTRNIAKNKITKPVERVVKLKNGKRANKGANKLNSARLIRMHDVVSCNNRDEVALSISNAHKRSSAVLESFNQEQYKRALQNDVCPYIRGKSIAMFKENIKHFEQLDMIMDSCCPKLAVGLRAMIYNSLLSFLQVISKCKFGDDFEEFDESLAENIMDFSLRVFSEDFDDVKALVSAKELGVKICCLSLLEPILYRNIDDNIQVKMITRLFVFIGTVVRDLGTDMQALGVGDREISSTIILMLLGSAMKVVDDRKLHLLIIDIICNSTVVSVDEHLLGAALLGYFIGVENEVDCVQRENDYLMVQKYLEDANNEGKLSAEFYTCWKLFAVSPYKHVREDNEKHKEECANLVADVLMREEELAKNAVGMGLKHNHKCKKETISRILKRKICGVIKHDKESSGELFDSKDLDKNLPKLDLGREKSDEDENNKRLMFLYEKMLNMNFEEAFKGFCECEEKEKIKSDSVGGLHLAIINILQFECLVERMKHECSTFLCLSKQSIVIRKYLEHFVEAASDDNLPGSISAKQLKSAYAKIEPLTDVLKAEEGILNKAIEYANKAASILSEFHEDGKEELGLLLLQEEQLREQIVQAGEVYQDMISILHIRRKVLGKIRKKSTTGSAGERVDIKANKVLESCNEAVKCVDKLRYKLAEFDKLKPSGHKSN